MSVPQHIEKQAERHAGLFLKLLRLAEFSGLFLVFPAVYAYALLDANRGGHRGLPMIPLLIGVALLCLTALLCDRTFSRRRLWNAVDLRRRLVPVLVVFLVAGIGLVAMVLFFQSGVLASVLDKRPGLAPFVRALYPLAGLKLFLSLVRNHPVFWVILMVLYPLLSVYPQELIYRAFLFHRYRTIFPTPWVVMFASAAAFGFMHVVFWNVPAVVLSFFGGLLFAWTYHRTQSLLAAFIEHSLYGCLIFTIGLGAYFFPGTISLVARMTG